MKDGETDYRRLIDNLGKEYLFYRHDAAGRMTYVSPSMTGMLGYTPLEFAVHYTEYLTDHPANRTVEERTASALQGLPQPPYELEIFHKNGAKLWLEVAEYPLRDADGKVVAVEGIAKDVTQRKRMEDALRGSQQLIKGIVNAMPARVFWKGRDYLYLGCNAAFARDAGFAEPDDLIGKSDFDLVWKEQASLYRADDRQVMESGRPKLLIEEPQTTADGKTVVLLTSKIPLLDSDGRIIGVLGTYMDITDRKHAQDMAGTLQKLESLGVLAGGIAHDFNNVLTVILGNLSLLQSRVKDDRESVELAQEAQDACEHARGLSNQLLTFAKGGAPVAAPMDLKPVLREAAAFAARNTGTRCVFDLGDAPLPVNIDKLQVASVIQNLILNAAQAMPGGGEIAIRASLVDKGARFVRVEVEDHGPGIDPKHITKIFDPYFSTKGAGRGLGLATCYSIMARHGGNISTLLKPRAGAVFILHFPAAAAGDAKPAETGATSSRTGRILVMDDDPPVAQVLTRMIEHLGYEAVAVDRGEAALAAYARAHDESEPFGAVILDLTVREGLGGMETLERLKALDPGVKALVSSGYANAPIMAEYAAKGFRAALVKPYRLEDVGAALRRVVGPLKS